MQQEILFFTETPFLLSCPRNLNHYIERCTKKKLHNFIMDAARVMKGGILTMFFLFCFLCISDTSIAEKPPSEAIRKVKKINYQEDQFIFSSSASTTVRDTSGNVPIVNPTTPGTTPMVNPTPPPSPTTTGPTITPPTPTGPTITPPTPTGPITLPPTPPVPTMTPPTPRGPTQTPPTPTGPVMTPPTSTGPGTNTPGSSGGGSWCIASPSASETALQVALDYACGYGGTDCSAIQSGASCYDPNTVRDHASYAFNSYYQKNPGPTSCSFGGVAQLTNTDPSRGNCHYPSSNTNTSPPTTPTMPTTPMTPPSTTSPVTPYMPGGGTGSGTEPGGFDNGSAPIGTPSSAKSTSYSLLLLITMNCILLIATEIYS